MKSTTKTKMAEYAGVCLETFSSWLKPHQQTLTQMGYPPGKRSIPPNVVEWMCHQFCIKIDPPRYSKQIKHD
jgi:hypothetical protein